MYQLVDEIINIDYEELSTMDIPINYRFGLCVNLRGVKYEMLVYFKSETDKVVCLGAGAMADDSTHDNTRPFFHRHGWVFDASTIWYNDPTRYLNINLKGAWGVRTEEDYYLKNIGDIIVKLLERLNLKRENLFFYGSSMGGFTSLQLATMVKDSTALADIPQLEFQNHVSYERIKPFCFPGLSNAEIWDRFKHRFDVIELMKKEDYIPKAILVLDCGDRDINTQYIDFIKHLNQLPQLSNKENKIKIVFNYTLNHEPLSILESRTLVNAVTSKNCLAYLNELEDTDMYKENKILKEENEELTKALIMWGEESIERLKSDEIIRIEKEKNAKLQEEIRKKNEIIANLNTQLNQKQNEIDTMLSSNSWKITKPMRNMRSTFRK